MKEAGERTMPSCPFIYENEVTDIDKRTIITSEVFVDRGDDCDYDDHGNSSYNETSTTDTSRWDKEGDTSDTDKHCPKYKNEIITDVFADGGKFDGYGDESLEEILNSVSSLSGPDDGKVYPKNVITNKNMELYTRWRHGSVSMGGHSPCNSHKIASPMLSSSPKAQITKSGRRDTVKTRPDDGVSSELEQSLKTVNSQMKDDEEKTNYEMFVSELSSVNEGESNRLTRNHEEKTGKEAAAAATEELALKNIGKAKKAQEERPLTMSARYPKLRKTLQSLIDDEDVDSDGVDESLFLSRRSVKMPSAQSKPIAVALGKSSECVEISSVPVPVFLSPLGEIRTKVRAAVDREEASGSELASSSSPGTSALSGSSSTGHTNQGKIEFVTFYNSRAMDSTEFVKRENIKRSNESELIKYKGLIDASLTRCRTDRLEIETQQAQLREKVSEKISTYAGWHRPAFLATYRRAVQLKAGTLDVQDKVLEIKTPALERKLDQVDRLIGAVQEGRFFVIKPAFYVNPNDNFSKEQEALVRLERRMEHGINWLKDKLKTMAEEYEKEMAQEERERRLIEMLEKITIPQEEVFFPLDETLQGEFDTWIRDTRTKEGATIDKFCKDLAAGISVDKSSVDLGFIELFIDELAHDIIDDYDAVSDSPDDRNDRKLALLIQRSLFPMLYQSAILLSPTPLRESSLSFLEKVGRLKEEKNPQIEIDNSLTRGGVNPFAEACRILSDLPFQLIPVEMISIVQKTITRISQLGGLLLAHDLGADEIIPFLVYVIVNTDLPGIHETLYMMSAVSDSQYGEFGWCVATFETAISFIEGVQETEEEKEG